MKVDVYYNLHKKTFSVRHKGKVIAHRDYVWVKDAQNVHAFVRGEWLEHTSRQTATEGTKYGGYASYNPYKAGTFMAYDLPIHKADAVLCIGYEEKPRVQYFKKEVA